MSSDVLPYIQPYVHSYIQLQLIHVSKATFRQKSEDTRWNPFSYFLIFYIRFQFVPVESKRADLWLYLNDSSSPAQSLGTPIWCDNCKSGI